MGLTAEATAELKSGLEKTFKDFDADGSGEVSTTEIEAMMLSLGLLVQPETLKAMMKEADTDNSGEISFDEFFPILDNRRGVVTPEFLGFVQQNPSLQNFKLEQQQIPSHLS